MRHLSTKQRERPLDSVPVVITDVACEPAVLFEPDFPAGTLRRADRILAHVLASPDADRNHGFCGAVRELQYWIDAWDARCKFGATWRRSLRCPGTAAKQHQRDVDADSLFAGFHRLLGTVQEVRDTKGFGAATKTGAIERLALDEEKTKHITPLSIGHLLPEAKPSKLLQQDVFGRVDIQIPIRILRHLNAPPPADLLLVQRRTAGDEQIHLDGGRLVDEIHTRMLTNSTTNRGVICVELRAQFGQESIDVLLGNGDHNVHVDRGPWLAADRAGERAADQVEHSAGFKGVCHLKGDLNRTERHA